MTRSLDSQLIHRNILVDILFFNILHENKKNQVYFINRIIILANKYDFGYRKYFQRYKNGELSKRNFIMFYISYCYNGCCSKMHFSAIVAQLESLFLFAITIFAKTPLNPQTDPDCYRSPARTDC